jgi:hypothetical protein
MTFGQKWLYAAMALTGGFLGGVASMGNCHICGGPASVRL